MAAGFNAPISGVFFAVESVLQKPGAKDEFGDIMDSSVAANSSGLTIAMVLLASVVAAVVSQVACLCHSWQRAFCMIRPWHLTKDGLSRLPSASHND